MSAAAVPDPRFRDQLAEALWCRDVGSNDAPPLSEQGEGTQRVYRSDADGMLLRLAPVMEARVQAAGNQRAAEAEGAVIRVVQLAQQWEINAQSSRDVGIAAVALVAAGQLRAALASPAPALQTGEGQR